MTDARLMWTLAASVVVAVGCYFLIGFACTYGVLATIMTGRITIGPIWWGLPYRAILSAEVALVLYALYSWMQQQGIARRDATPFADPVQLTTISVGIAVIGFLSTSYPCPVSIDLWLLLSLVIPIFGAFIPYWVVIAAAGCLLLYAAYMRERQRQV